MAGRPPVKAMTRLMTNEAKSPTEGSTPATNEKAMTSGWQRKRATAPASNSRECWAPIRRAGGSRGKMDSWKL